MISGYYCNKCESGRGYLDHLQTGDLLSTQSQSGYFQKHTLGCPESPTNGVFLATDTGIYQSIARQIGSSGFVEIELGGGVNAYLNFNGPIGIIQFSGTPSGNSTLGKAVLINNSDYVHCYPATGYGSGSGSCANCGQKLF